MPREVMGVSDYLTSESSIIEGTEELLDFYTEQPNPNLQKSGDKALAEIAAAINKNAPKLTKAQLELAVKWLKLWKCHDYPTPSPYEFEIHLNGLRESAEQVTLRQKAHRKLWQSLAIAALSFVLLDVAIFFWAADFAWYVIAPVIILSFILVVRAKANAVEGATISVDQDRRYFLQCLRDAGTTGQMAEAGLYNHMKGVMLEPGKPYDGKLARRLIAGERERIADALYFDQEGYLDPRELK